MIQQLNVALSSYNLDIDETNVDSPKEDPLSDPPTGPLTAEAALCNVGDPSTPFNWVLLEPSHLTLHHAGQGGLCELKGYLPSDQVLFGVLRFSSLVKIVHLRLSNSFLSTGLAQRCLLCAGDSGIVN